MSDIPSVSYNANEAAPSADTASTSASANSDTAAPSSNGGGFAVALDNAGPKPVRKPPANKDHAASGGQMPVPGNVSPPSTLLVPLAPVLPAAAIVTPPAAAAVAAASTNADAAKTAVPAAPIQGAAADTAIPDGSSKAAAPNPQVWVAPVLGPDPKDADSAPPAIADATSKMPGDTLIPPLTGPAASTLAGLAAAKAGATAGSTAAGAGQASLAHSAAANNAATSARTGAANPSANFASGASDAASQAVSGAALSAAAIGVVAAGKTDDADTDDLATAATGTVAQAAAASGGTPVVTVPIAAFRAATISAASVSAAASRAAQAASPLYASSADKHGLSSSADSFFDAGSGLSAAAGQLSASSTTAIDVTATPTLKVSAGVDTPEFGQGLSERVSWMLDNNVSSAKLQVNPPQLGPIEVRISLQGDHAQVWLTSHSAVTRDALESSSPKLREMLGAQGFGQVSVDISQRSFQERSTQSQPYDWTPGAARGAATTAQAPSGPVTRTSNGVLDAYA